MASDFRVLFICMGNFCRSPTAEGVFRHMVRDAGLQDHIRTDSAGTHDYHAGEPPDERSCHHASMRGYDLSDLRARQVQDLDFERFDLICVMDWDNLRQLEDDCPPQHRPKLRRLMEFAPEGLADIVADPSYGGDQGFETALDHIEAASVGLLQHIRGKLNLAQG